MQFAINELGFQPEDILMFGWSIGGYSSLVATAQYPDIKGTVRFIFFFPIKTNFYAHFPIKFTLIYYI